MISKEDTIRKNIEDLENEQNVFEELLEKNVLERAELDFIDQLKKQYIKDHLGRFYVHNKNVYYSQTSLWLFSTRNKFRNLCVWIMKWK
jgi:hypothetical protein